MKYDRSFAGFTQFLGDFRLSSVPRQLNLDTEEGAEAASHETERVRRLPPHDGYGARPSRL